MTIDGVPVFSETLGGPQDLHDVDVRQSEAAEEMQARFMNIRVKVKAGPHKVGVSFVQRSFAESDSPLQPIAMLPEMERAPTIPGIDIAGPFNVSGVGETESRKRIFVCHPASPAEEPSCAKTILTRLATEAFRRPVNEEDLKAPMSFYAMGRQAGGDFEAGIESGLTSILSSSKFLFRAEPVTTTVANAAAANTPAAEPQPGTASKVTDLELASRLSFFLWSSGPDKQLLDLATSGKLHEAAVLKAQVSRMLADPRSESLVTNFAFQWLNVGRIDVIQPDPVLYPEFDPALRAAFREEIRLFMGSVLRQNHSVLELLSSDQTFLNERLAIHYGVPEHSRRAVPAGETGEREPLGPARQGRVAHGNVVRQPYFASAAWSVHPREHHRHAAECAAAGRRAVRGIRAGQKKTPTVRERLEQHRAAPSCNGCHGVMDPLGFALENYDVVGAWRDIDRDAGSPIDASGQLASGVHVGGPAELNRALLARPDQFVQALTEKLMTFALGRAVRYQDMPSVRAIVRDAAASNYRFESILEGIVTSQAFQMRQVPTAAPDQKQASLAEPQAMNKGVR